MDMGTKDDSLNPLNPRLSFAVRKEFAGAPVLGSLAAVDDDVADRRSGTQGSHLVAKPLSSTMP